MRRLQQRRLPTFQSLLPSCFYRLNLCFVLERAALRPALRRYDGSHWKGYFDHDSGLASNFINFVRAVGDVVYLCSDDGLSSFNSEEWISYRKTNTGGNRIYWKDGVSSTKADPTGIAHSFTIGVDVQEENTIWVATSYGLSRGTRIN